MAEMECGCYKIALLSLVETSVVSSLSKLGCKEQVSDECFRCSKLPLNSSGSLEELWNVQHFCSDLLLLEPQVPMFVSTRWL